ncbi:hypothetical protein [Amycolatopsis sp. lyj-109]|uniref:hypothetical protein n=1 Tax=Amycolatopsis sp. lyj-109 TaxID=2789287 RepID=UPI0039794E67
MTSTYRLLDALDLFGDDFRVRFVFTVNATSAFSDGVPDFLRDAGITPIPWTRVAAGDVHYDLALSASENIDFEHIRAHTIVLPHGLGFNKYVPDRTGTGQRIAGLPPEWVLRDGKATVTLQHPEQITQLLAACPATAGQTAVVGDAAFDRVEASRGLRAHYRAELGTGDRILITLASTWRTDSLLGRQHSLPLHLLGELPADSYQVCAVLHPNIWARYGRHQIHLWLSSALDAGLVLMPPHAGWQAALIAADQVLTDHGSLGLVAAALDKPLLLSTPTEETVVGSPPHLLARSAPALVPDAPLLSQVEEARASHQPGQYAAVTSRVFAHTGEAATNLRNLIYDKLALAPLGPDAPVRRIPLPVPLHRRVRSHVVQAAIPADGALDLTRIPAAAMRAEYPVDAHVVADETELELKIVERAAAIVRCQVLDAAEARTWARATLDANPGARLAVTATPDGCSAMVRGAGQAWVGSPGWQPEDVAPAASAVYCCWLSRTLGDRTLTVRTGARVHEFSLRFTPSGTAPAAP